MSTIGYNGRDLYVQLDDVTIAAITSKSITNARDPVDVTTDDSNGFRVILPEPGLRYVDASIEGVATSANMALIRAEWEGNVNSDITIVNEDGSTMTAANGFFLGSLEITGESAGAVTFTATLMSSGAITITPAS